MLTQHPLAQKCLSQYLFFRSLFISKILIVLFPFRKPSTSEIENFGGNDSTKWRWSACTLPSNISTFFHSHSCLITSRTYSPTSPFKILNRYFGYQTIWYLHCQTACANLLKSFIEYLLLMFRATTLHFNEVFFLCKSPTYPQGKAETISIAEGLRD